MILTIKQCARDPLGIDQVDLALTVGVLEPGRLRIYRVGRGGDDVTPIPVETAREGEWALPKFLNDATAGESDVPRRRYLANLLQGSAAQATALGLSDVDA